MWNIETTICKVSSFISVKTSLFVKGKKNDIETWLSLFEHYAIENHSSSLPWSSWISGVVTRTLIILILTVNLQGELSEEEIVIDKMTNYKSSLLKSDQVNVSVNHFGAGYKMLNNNLMQKIQC